MNQPIKRVNEESGEEEFIILYREGRPWQVRFDAKEGAFKEAIPGTAHQLRNIGKELTLQPVAWRFFTGDILKMGKKDWVELFYVNEQNYLTSVLLHSWSVANLKELEDPLFYTGTSLADIVLTITPDKKENTKIQPKGVYYIANFSYVMGDPERTKDLQRFAESVNIFREQTIEAQSVIAATHCYNLPQHLIDKMLGLSGESDQHLAIDAPAEA